MEFVDNESPEVYEKSNIDADEPDKKWWRTFLKRNFLLKKLKAANSHFYLILIV